MDLKRETESYLARKASAVLDQAFGHGQAMASVDVTLNMDQVRVTTEDVLAATDAKGPATSGVLVRERETARDGLTAEQQLVGWPLPASDVDLTESIRSRVAALRKRGISTTRSRAKGPP